MYSLLGDPATHIHLPAALTAKITPTAGKWQWSVERPKGATNLYVALQAGGSLTGSAAKGDSRSEATAAHEAANAKLALECGYTAARSGGSLFNIDFWLKKAIENDLMPGPRMASSVRRTTRSVRRATPVFRQRYLISDTE